MARHSFDQVEPNYCIYTFIYSYIPLREKVNRHSLMENSDILFDIILALTFLRTETNLRSHIVVKGIFGSQNAIPVWFDAVQNYYYFIIIWIRYTFSMNSPVLGKPKIWLFSRKPCFISSNLLPRAGRKYAYI